MKKLLLTAFMALLTIAGTYASRQELTITVQGKERKYCLVKSDAGFNNRIVFMLHGLGGTYNDFDANTIQAFANINFCNVILPQALPEQDETLLSLLNLVRTYSPEIDNLYKALQKSAWGANVYVTIDDLCKALGGMTKEQLEIFIKLYPQYQPYYDAGKIQINKTERVVSILRKNGLRYVCCGILTWWRHGIPLCICRRSQQPFEENSHCQRFCIKRSYSSKQL